jgi:DNA/RNA-binding domain of Phe-tRNA-synthetase-like protein
MAGHDWVRALLNTASSAPVATSDRVRDAVRNALRATGFKPAGRNKPCPEYLARVAAEGGLPSINPVADIGNAVALHSGLPVSVVDPDRLTEPLSVRVAEEGSKYVFNASGQEIDVGRLVCLFDAVGPCACAVKDAQRAKTTPDTARALNLIWGCEALADHVVATEKWFRELLAELGARERE